MKLYCKYLLAWKEIEEIEVIEDTRKIHIREWCKSLGGVEGFFYIRNVNGKWKANVSEKESVFCDTLEEAKHVMDKYLSDLGYILLNENHILLLE